MGQVHSNLPEKLPQGSFKNNVEDASAAQLNERKDYEGPKLSSTKRASRNASLISATLIETENFKNLKRGLDRTDFIGITKYEAGMQLFKVLIGTGILLLPEAFHNVGIGLGVILTLVIAVITIRTFEFVVGASQHFSKLNNEACYSYSDTFRLALQKWPSVSHLAIGGQYLVTSLIIVATYTVCMVYVLLIARNVQDVLRALATMEAQLGVIIAIQFPLLILATSFTSLKRLTPITAIAIIALWFGICLTVYEIVEELLNKTAKMEEEKWDFKQIPGFLSIVLFAFNGIPSLTAIENNMKDPGQFIGCPSVVSVVVMLVACVYMAYGLLGYLTFGSNTKGPITESFVQNETFSIILKIAIAIGLFFSCPIILFAPLKIVSEYAYDKAAPRRKTIMSIAMKWLQLLVIIAVPLLVDNLLTLLQLLGGFNLILQFIIPIIIDCLTFTSELRGVQQLVATSRNVLLLIIAIIFVGLTFYGGVRDVLTLYKLI